MPRFIVMSGLPASGKTSLGMAIAAALGVPHLDKDVFLEERFDHVQDARFTLALRSRLSREADVAFQQAAIAADCAVLTSWWRHPGAVTGSGTDSAWLAAQGVQVAEVHCVVSPELALARFRRRQMHPGHLDGARDMSAMRAQFVEAAERGPLFPLRALPVATHVAIDGQTLRHLSLQATRLAGMDDPAVEWPSG